MSKKKKKKQQQMSLLKIKKPTKQKKTYDRNSIWNEFHELEFLEWSLYNYPFDLDSFSWKFNIYADLF